MIVNMTEHKSSLLSSLGTLIGVVWGASFIDPFFQFLQDERNVVGKYFKGAGTNPYSFKGVLLAAHSFAPMVLGGLIGNRVGKLAESSTREKARSDQLEETNRSLMLVLADNNTHRHSEKVQRERQDNSQSIIRH
jgi:hypothetical protein